MLNVLNIFKVNQKDTTVIWRHSSAFIVKFGRIQRNIQERAYTPVTQYENLLFLLIIFKVGSVKILTLFSPDPLNKKNEVHFFFKIKEQCFRNIFEICLYRQHFLGSIHLTRKLSTHQFMCSGLGFVYFSLFRTDRFSDVSMGYKKVTLASNGSNTKKKNKKKQEVDCDLGVSVLKLLPEVTTL